jgi:hypothetical protein
LSTGMLVTDSRWRWWLSKPTQKKFKKTRSHSARKDTQQDIFSHKL